MQRALFVWFTQTKKKLIPLAAQNKITPIFFERCLVLCTIETLVNFGAAAFKHKQLANRSLVSKLSTVKFIFYNFPMYRYFIFYICKKIY